jgi:hypothetical protein
MMGLRHPNVAQVYELADDDGGPFFTMEFVEGRDLRSMMRGGLSSLGIEWRSELAISLASQVLPALALLHGQGFAHRDVKPSNLVFGRGGVVKLIDFGSLARWDDRKTPVLDDRAAGTPRYMAPERFLEKGVSPASDLYALGLVLLEMVAGRLLTEEDGEDVDAVRGPFLRMGGTLSQVPDELATLTEALLQPDPRGRPDARQALGMLGIALPAPRHRASGVGGAAAGSHPRGDSARWLAPRIERVREGLFVSCFLEGPGQSGKTKALEAARDAIRGFGGLVLAGRGRPEERIRYNVLDAAIDTLAGLSLEVPLDAELARHVRIAATAFPVFAGRSSVGGSRADAIDALIGILASFAGSEGIFICVDDLHWADECSLALLDRLLACRPRGVGLLATVGTDFENLAFYRWLHAQQSIERKSLDGAGSIAGRRQSA